MEIVFFSQVMEEKNIVTILDRKRMQMFSLFI